jgi:hypothetical protein
MNEQEAAKLQEKLHTLIKIVTDPNLWNFLTDNERKQVAKVLEQV